MLRKWMRSAPWVASLAVLIAGALAPWADSASSGSPLRVVGATTSRSVREPGPVPVGVTDRFAPNDPEVHLVISLESAVAGSAVKGVLVAVDAADTPNYPVVSAEVPVKKSGSAQVHFTFKSPDRGWPPGNYRVDLRVDGQYLTAVPFSIEAVPPAPPAAAGDRSAPRPGPGLLAPPAQAGGFPSFAGRYRYEEGQVVLALALDQGEGGKITGSLSSSAGAQFSVEGAIHGETASGSCRGEAGGTYFEAKLEGGALQFALIGVRPDGAPNTSDVRVLAFRREEPAAAAGNPLGQRSQGAEVPALGRRSQSARAAPSSSGGDLIGTWRYQGSEGAVDLVIRDERHLSFDGDDATYQAVPGALRVQTDEGLQDYPYALDADTLTITFPDGTRVPFRRIRGAPESAAPRQRASNGSLQQQIAGVWWGYSGSTERKIGLCPDGSFRQYTESGYSGRMSDSGGYQTGAWGTANQSSGSGSWNIEGNTEAGTIYVRYQNGSTAAIRYRQVGARGCLDFDGNRLCRTSATCD